MEGQQPSGDGRLSNDERLRAALHSMVPPTGNPGGVLRSVRRSPHDAIEVFTSFADPVFLGNHHQRRDPTFDPWTASEQRALSFDEEYLSPEYFAYSVAKQILASRDEIEQSGTKMLQALSTALAFGLTPPDWLVQEFLSGVSRLDRHEVSSLDEAFEVTPKTERRRLKLRRDRELRPKVFHELLWSVMENPSRPIDSNDLFAEVGAKLGIGKTLCRQIYDDGVKEGHPDLVAFKELARVAKDRQSA